MAKKKMGKNMLSSPGPISEKDWRAKEDARTLANAKVIMTDKARLKAAANAAKEIAECRMEEAKAMRSVAKKG